MSASRRLQLAHLPVGERADGRVVQLVELALNALRQGRLHDVRCGGDALQRRRQRACLGGIRGHGDQLARFITRLPEARRVAAEANQIDAPVERDVGAVQMRLVALGEAADLGAQPASARRSEALGQRPVDVGDREPRAVGGAALPGAGEVAQPQLAPVRGGALQQGDRRQPVRPGDRLQVEAAGIERGQRVGFDFVVAPVIGQQQRAAVERCGPGARVVAPASSARSDRGRSPPRRRRARCDRWRGRLRA